MKINRKGYSRPTSNKTKIGTEQEGRYHFGEWSVGITISRRPNRRQSSENAPGPRKTRAIAIATTMQVVSLASKKFGVGTGSHESAIPALPKPTRTQAIGVRKPIRSKTPLATASKPTTDTPNVELAPSFRYAPP